MGMVAPKLWTVDEVLALPDDGQRYEVIDGELFVSPAPRWTHQAVLGVIQHRLYDYLRRERVGHVLHSPADIEYGPRTLVQPDLFVVPLVDGRRAKEWAEVRALLLVVEVLSPSTARLDRNKKRRLYQRERVPEYWIVDVDARVIERWRPDDDRAELLDDEITWHPAGATNALRIDLPELFAEVIDG